MSFACDACGKATEVDDALAGRKGKCAACGATVRVPGERKKETAPHEAPTSRCSGCGCALKPGFDRCARCGPRSTPRRLLLVSLGFLALGVPGAAVGGMFAFALSKGTGVAVVAVWMGFALGVAATCAGLIDLLRALAGLGEDEVRPLATKWIADQLGG